MQSSSIPAVALLFAAVCCAGCSTEAGSSNPGGRDRLTISAPPTRDAVDGLVIPQG